MKFNKRRDIRDVFNLLDILASINSTASVKSSVQPGRFITVDRKKTLHLYCFLSFAKLRCRTISDDILGSSRSRRSFIIGTIIVSYEKNSNVNNSKIVRRIERNGVF